MKTRGKVTLSNYSIRPVKLRIPVPKENSSGRREYATTNNRAKVNPVIHHTTAVAITCANGLAWTPEMEDAILTGRATRCIDGEDISVTPPVAQHRSHLDHYAKKTAPRRPVHIRRKDIITADKWARRKDKVVVSPELVA